MKIEDILIIRHELMLTLIILILLVWELTVAKKHSVIFASIILFAVYAIAGFLPAAKGVLFGGMYQSTCLTDIIKNILNLGVFIILLQSVVWFRKQEYEDKISEYYILMFSSLLGMYFMISSGSFLMLYLGIEMATIPVAAMAAYDKYKNKSAEAGVKLILSSALSSGILLYGIAMIYGANGSIYFDDISATFFNDSINILGLLFFTVGMGFKISLVPFHLWTADVYEGAPVNVTSFLSVISKGSAAFVFMITLFTVFKIASSLWLNVLYLLAVSTMTIGNLFAMRQDNLKRFLAFSSIAQAGFILLGIMGIKEIGITSVIYFILVYIFTNLGAFGVVSVISAVTGKEKISDYKGLYKTNPLLSLIMLLSLFSLAGIPPVAGFFGKFFLFTSAAGNGFYILVLIAVLNATISLYYYLLVVKAMFIDKNDTPIAKFNSDFFSRLSLLLCVAGIFIIGFTSWIYEFIKSAIDII